MNRTRKWIGLIFSILVTGWLISFALKTLPEANFSATSSPKVWWGIFLASLLYVSIIPISAFAWSRLLSAQNIQVDALKLTILMGRTQLAKYIPGNVAQHGVRMALAIREKIPITNYATSVLQETLLALIASIAVGFIAIYTNQKNSSALQTLSIPRHDWLIFVVPLCLLLLVALHYIARKFSWAATLRMPPMRTLTAAFALYTANYLLIGTGLTVLARAMELPHTLGFAAATGAFALSWMLGFLAPGAPAGLGVREGLMLALLVGLADADSLLLFVALARVSTILGDGICFLISWAVDSKKSESI